MSSINKILTLVFFVATLSVSTVVYSTPEEEQLEEAILASINEGKNLPLVKELLSKNARYSSFFLDRMLHLISQNMKSIAKNIKRIEDRLDFERFLNPLTDIELADMKKTFVALEGLYLNLSMYKMAQEMGSRNHNQ